MEYFKYDPGFRDSYFVEKDGAPKRMRDGAALNWNLKLVDWLYWENRLHLDMDETSVVRHVGWDWEAGVRFNKIDLYHHHHSRHGLEYINPRSDSFPVEDSYGIRFKFIVKEK